MKECDILGVGIKTYSDPSYIFSGAKTPKPLWDLRPCAGRQENSEFELDAVGDLHGHTPVI